MVAYTAMLEIFAVANNLRLKEPQKSKTQKFNSDNFYHSKYLQPFETANNRLQRKLNAQK